MAQVASYLVTASGPAYNFDREQELTLDELEVLQQYLKQLKAAFERHVASVPSSTHTYYILIKLNQYEKELGFLNEYKQRRELVSFASNMALKNEDYFGPEVVHAVSEFLRYWEERALMKQV